jgi:signal transduction histidine kinase
LDWLACRPDIDWISCASQRTLVALAGRGVAEYRRHSQPEGIRLATTEDELIGQWDPWRLERVLRNLLSNALDAPEQACAQASAGPGGAIVFRSHSAPDEHDARRHHVMNAHYADGISGALATSLTLLWFVKAES